MVKSMTAYGHTEIRVEWGELSCELRSVNHRYLELSMRLPGELRALEPKLREILSARLKRGKVDCTIRFKSNDNQTDTLNLNKPVITSLINAHQQIQKILGGDTPLKPLDILKWPGVVAEGEKNLEPVQTATINLLNETLNDFIDTRQREGEKLKAEILQRCEAIEAIQISVNQYRPQMMARLRDRLQTKLDEISAEIDPQRLEQELVFAAQKLDVTEELDRLKAHVEEVKEVLNRDEAIGRRLDFLMQELNREANTLGSKSYDTETSKNSVDLKVLIEQIREQVQNIE